MAWFEHDGAQLHYDRLGSGPPLLLLTGLGLGSWAWYRQIDHFAPSFDVVGLDNRGAARSSAPPGPYTIPQLADDARALLDHLGIDSAHVLGISMGGYVAQTLAVRNPTRVRSLVLGCTAFGGVHAVRMTEADYALLRAEAESGFASEACRSGLILRFSAACLRHRGGFVADYLERRTKNAGSAAGWAAQAAACAAFDLEAETSSIRCPTLIVTGDDDRIVPARNSELLQSRIAGSVLMRLRGGHLFFIENAERFNAAATEFLAGVDSTFGSESSRDTTRCAHPGAHRG